MFGLKVWIDYVLQVPAVGFQEGGSSFRRKLSKREKKQLKKQEKLNKIKMNAPVNNENDGGVAGKLYTGAYLLSTCS
jgi:afadin